MDNDQEGNVRRIVPKTMKDLQGEQEGEREGLMKRVGESGGLWKPSGFKQGVSQLTPFLANIRPKHPNFTKKIIENIDCDKYFKKNYRNQNLKNKFKGIKEGCF